VEPTPAVSPTSEAAPSSTVVPATLAPETTPPPAQATPTLKPVATPPTQAGGTAEARRALRAGQLREAGRGFNAHLASVSAQSFSIQILVACADETIAKAVGVTDSPELFILPVNLKGRACYRLCWGVYADQAQAAAAIRTIPEYFRQGGTTPRAVPITALR
jgi:septal ring-binding cell division protein DamX